MKYAGMFILIVAVNLFPRLCRSQSPGELYITPYDNGDQPVFFCGGIQQNEIQITYGIANILYPDDTQFIIDSILFQCDTSVFQYVVPLHNIYLGNGVGLNYGPVYSPTHVGTDTLRIVGYYGQYTTTAMIVCHAEASPDIGLSGWTRTKIDFGGGNAVYDLNPQIRTDTLHDEMGSGFSYPISTTPQKHGLNPNVMVVTCGGAIIDSIYTVGDFSDFQFTNLPTAPVTLGEHDSLVISYVFTPHTKGQFPHYLVFHTTSGQYLVWSFEYSTHGVSGVISSGEGPHNDLVLQPNPATTTLRIRIGSYAGTHPQISIYNSLGVRVQTIQTGRISAQAEDDASEYDANVSQLPNGSYTIVCTDERGTTTSHLIIAR